MRSRQRGLGDAGRRLSLARAQSPRNGARARDRGQGRTVREGLGEREGRPKSGFVNITHFLPETSQRPESRILPPAACSIRVPASVFPWTTLVWRQLRGTNLEASGNQRKKSESGENTAAAGIRLQTPNTRPSVQGSISGPLAALPALQAVRDQKTREGPSAALLRPPSGTPA